MGRRDLQSISSDDGALGIVDPVIGDPETLIERLFLEAREHPGPFPTPIYAGAWATKQR
jgi:hypothetical protein